MDQGELIGRWLFVGMCLGAIVLVGANGLVCAPSLCTAFWFGEAGYLGTLINACSFLALSVGGFLAWRSYRLSERGALAAKYQAGVQLLAGATEVEQVGGINILIEVAREDEVAFLRPVVKTLLSAIVDKGGPVLDQQFLAPVSYWPLVTSAEPLLGLTSIQFSSRWPEGSATPGPAIEAYAAYLDRTNIWGRDFRKISINGGTFRRVTFVKCDFEDCTISGVIYETVIFEDCNLTGATLKLDVWRGTQATFLARDCRLKGATLNGSAVPVEEVTIVAT